MVLIKLRLV